MFISRVCATRRHRLGALPKGQCAALCTKPYGYTQELVAL